MRGRSKHGGKQSLARLGRATRPHRVSRKNARGAMAAATLDQLYHRTVSAPTRSRPKPENVANSARVSP